MKLLVTCFFALISNLGVSQETFHVLHVEGIIIMDTSKVALKVGDEIIGNPNFQFSSETDKALLLSNLKGRVVLFQNTPKQQPTGEVAYYFKNNILPIKDYTGSRGNDENISFLFFDENKLVLPRKIKVFKIPDSEESYYEFQFEVGAELVKKRLPLLSHGFLELNSDLFQGLSQLKNSIMNPTMYYIDNESNTLIESLKFQIIYLSKVREEVRFYQDWLTKKGKSETEVNEILGDFINHTYGSEITLGQLN